MGNPVLDATSPHGPTTWKFSGKDMVGNRGTGQGNGPIIDVRGPKADITAPLTLLKSSAGPVAVSFTLDEQSTTTPVLELKATDGTTATAAGLTSADGLRWTGTLDPATLPDGTARFILSQVADRFGNANGSVGSGATIIVYRDTPPAPPAPETVTAKGGNGGVVTIAWSKVYDATKYLLYRRAEGDSTVTRVAEVAAALLTTTDIPPTDGTWHYSVASLGLLDSESARSDEASATSDRTGPPAPTGLSLSLTGNGLQAVWEAPASGSEAPFAYRLYRANAPITAINGLTPVATVKGSPAVDPSPTNSLRFYAVTALDSLGNESAPTAAPEFSFPVAPVRNLVLTRVDDAAPTLSWEGGEAGLQGFHIYRNGSRITQSPTSSTTYSDGYYAGGSVTYGISEVSGLGVESPVREVLLPPLTVGVKDGTTLRRGMLETVSVVAALPAQSQGEGININSITLKIGNLPESTLTGPFTVTPTAAAEISKVAATEATSPSQLAVVTTAVISPAPGTTVKITKSGIVSVLVSGTALEIFNDPLVRGTEAKVRLKVNNLGSARTEFLTSENNGATGHVKVILKDQDGNLLAQGNLDQRTGSAIVNSGNYATARLEPGATFTSDPIKFIVPSTAPSKVILEAVVQNTYYHYNQTDQVVAPGLKQTIEATISEVAYTAQAIVAKTIYRQGETITITGKALSTADGAPMAAVPVKIGVSVNGFDRYFAATTDQTGNFTYAFTPGANETGTYSVWAIHPELSDRTVQAQFSIIGLSVSPKLINVTTTRNKPVDVTITIRNLSGSPLTCFTLTSASSSGIDATVVNAGSDVLSGGETRNVTLHIAPQSTAANSGYASISITTAEGLTDTVEANITLVTAVPVITTSPSYIDTGIVRGNQKIVTFNLSNTGIETLKNVRIEGPSLPWLALTVDKSLGDVGIGQSKSAGILIKPGETVPQAIYNDRLVIYSDNHIPYIYNIQVTVTSNAVGNVQFDVLDEILRDVSNATITFQNQSVLELIQTVRTGADGTAMAFDLPEGRYSFNISASGAKAYSGSFIIEPGMTTTVPIALELNLVTIEWSVTPTVIEDTYEVSISQTFETNVPTPVLITEPPSITLPELQPGQVFNGEFTVTNYGLIEVYDLEVNFPTSFEDYDIEILASAIPTKLGAMQKITIPYRITRRVQTAASTDIYDEVTSYGGATCYKSVGGTIKGKCVICPKTLFERVVEKITSFTYLLSTPCATGTTTTTITPIPSHQVGGVVLTAQSSGAGSGWTNTIPIKTSNPCDCEKEGTLIAGEVCKECKDGKPADRPDGSAIPNNECKECRGGQSANKPEGTACKDDKNPLTVDICKNGICVHLSTCDLTSGYKTDQNRYDDIIKCAAIATGVNPHVIKEVIKAESSFDKDPPIPGDNSTGLMQVIPSTARSVGLSGTDEEIITKLKNPCTNIEIGAKFLAKAMSEVKQYLDNAKITYSDEDLRIYLEAYFNLGTGTFQAAIDTATSQGISINSWEDFTTVQEKLGKVSIFRYVIGEKLEHTAKGSCCYDSKGKIRKSADLKLNNNKSKRVYDNNNNSVLDKDEWYDWRTEKVLLQDRLYKLSDKFKSREVNACPAGSFTCDEAKKNSQCNK